MDRSRRVVLLVAIGLGSAALVVPSDATAFVTFPGVYAKDMERVEAAPRWNFNTVSLEEHSGRGLGGGLEYAVSPEFCRRVSSRFQGAPPACDAVLHAVETAFAAWAAGNPNLHFVNVTHRISARLQPGHGAEIDLFALMPEEYPNLNESAAHTYVEYAGINAWSTNGTYSDGARVYSADIVVAYSRETCFFMDLERPASGCIHLPSLLLHEVGHAIGLHHPDEHAQRNVDQDYDPANEMTFDCKAITRGLSAGRPFDPAAVMVSMGPSEAPRETLAPDDRAGRDYLYPLCDGRREDFLVDQRRGPYRSPLESLALRPDFALAGSSEAPGPVFSLMALVVLIAVHHMRKRLTPHE